MIEGKGGVPATLVQGGGKRTDQLQAALDLVEKRGWSPSWGSSQRDSEHFGLWRQLGPRRRLD